MHVPQTEIILRHDGAELVRVSLPPGEYTIGRNRESEIFANTPLISRRHARLIINYDHLLLEDLGSSNGTFINDRPVTEATRLFPNQKIRLGDVEVEIHRQRVATQPGVSLAPTQATIHRLLPDELLALKRYAIGGVVARGGMGAILAAQQSAMKRGVAMKVMLENADETDVSRFIEEAQITGQLAHPNIVPVYELGVDENDQLYYTMKMVRGITLKKVLELLDQGIEATVNKYPLSVLLIIFQKVCDAIAFSHSKGVIHRDLKPENIMLDDFGVVLVMDWGLAKVIGAPAAARVAAAHLRSLIISPRDSTGGTSHTMMGTIMGTPTYMSPEQARGEVDSLDARSDIYALGAVLYHLLALRGPVAEGDPMAIVEKVAKGEYERLTPPAAKPGKPGHLPGGRIPDSLVAVVRKAMAFEKEARYQHVAELQSDLEAYQNGFATSAEKAGTGKQFLLTVRRHKGVTTSIAAAIVILVGVVTAFTSKVVGERNRAKSALADLQQAAPALADEGRKLVESQEFDDALSKFTFAVKIDPTNANYRLLRAQLLEASLKLDEAAAEFRNVLALHHDAALDEPVVANLTLCTQLLARYPTPDSLDAVSMQRLYEQFRREGRNAQAMPLAARLGRSRDTLKAVLESKLPQWRKLPGWDKRSETERVKQVTDGSYELSFADIPLTVAPSLTGLPISSLHLDNSDVSDLRPLAGLSLSQLSADNCRITDLTPLQGMPLRTLIVARNGRLRDLSPLHGMPLHQLTLTDTAVNDLRALQGAPVVDLAIGGCEFSNLSSLAGLPLARLDAQRCAGLTEISALENMPLRDLNLLGCLRIRDFSPLLDCPRLEYVILPVGVREVDVLRRHPRLWKLGTSGTSSYALQPADQFWEEFSPAFRPNAESESLLTKAHAAGVAVGKTATEDTIFVRDKGLLTVATGSDKLKQLPDYHGLQVTWLYVSGAPATDLSPLAGLPLRGLSIDSLHGVADLKPLAQCRELRFLAVTNGSKVSDLSPLHELPLTGLQLESSLVSDLAPLRGLPLRYLSLRTSKITDLTPLAELTELRDLVVAGSRVVDLAPLHKLRLQRLVASGTPINDLAPLTGLPLHSVQLDNTAVHDLRPLLDCPDLEEAVIPRGATNAEVLLKHPKLKRLSYDYDSSYGGPAQTTAEFWKDYAAVKAGIAK